MRGLIRRKRQNSKTFLLTKLHVDYEYFEEQRNIVQKGNNYIKEQLQKNTKNPLMNYLKKNDHFLFTTETFKV